jgi:hypothetical protein
MATGRKDGDETLGLPMFEFIWNASLFVCMITVSCVLWPAFAGLGLYCKERNRETMPDRAA